MDMRFYFAKICGSATAGELLDMVINEDEITLGRGLIRTDKSLCNFLNITQKELVSARKLLEDRDLLSFQNNVYTPRYEMIMLSLRQL